jgi:hypothetical protein
MNYKKRSLFYMAVLGIVMLLTEVARQWHDHLIREQSAKSVEAFPDHSEITKHSLKR